MSVYRRGSRRNARLTLLLFLGLCSGAACGEAGAPRAGGEIVVSDDAGVELRLKAPATRVVSLLPAATETIVALGAAGRLVGRTRYDRAPELQHLPSVGGGLDPSLEALTALGPDLVIVFETAGGSPLRARLADLGIPVFAVRTQDTTDIYRNIERLGALLGLPAAADSLRSDVRRRLAAVRAEAAGQRRPTVVFIAEVEPPIVAGPDVFVTQLLSVAGGDPVPSLSGTRQTWPQLSLEELLRHQPDVVMLPVHEHPEGAVARLRRAPGWRELRAVREGRIATVDADLANRPGPQIALTAERMRAALAPHARER